MDQNLLFRGSGILVQTVLRHGLVDELHQMVYRCAGERQAPLLEGNRLTLKPITSSDLSAGVLSTDAPAPGTGT